MSSIDDVLELVRAGHGIKLRPPPLPGWTWTVTAWPKGAPRPELGARQPAGRPRVFSGDEPTDACSRAVELLTNPQAGDPIGG